jgi:hypothetical protein
VTRAGLNGSGMLTANVGGDAGPDYQILVSTNLVNWQTLLITNPAVLPFGFMDQTATNFPQRFYRVLLGP